MEHQQTLSCDLKQRKKRKYGAAHIFRVALYMFGYGRKSKPGAATNWKKVVSAVRPLHIQGSHSSDPPRIPLAPEGLVVGIPQRDHEAELPFSPPLSPASAYTVCSSSTCDRSSRYASAVNLQELDRCDEADDNNGDEMIDVKAEQFIAQFYQQMRLQQHQFIQK